MKRINHNIKSMTGKNILSLCFIPALFLSCNLENKHGNHQTATGSTIQENRSLINAEKTETDYSEIGSAIMQSERIGELHYGLGLKKMIDLLGQPEEKSEPELWGADGEYHQTYQYPEKGIELDLIGKKETDQKINMITVHAPCEYKTQKGIGIGSSIDEVTNAYKDKIDPQASDNEMIVVGSVFGGLLFDMENNKVESIFIGASSE